MGKEASKQLKHEAARSLALKLCKSVVIGFEDQIDALHLFFLRFCSLLLKITEIIASILINFMLLKQSDAHLLSHALSFFSTSVIIFEKKLTHSSRFFSILCRIIGDLQ